MIITSNRSNRLLRSLKSPSSSTHYLSILAGSTMGEVWIDDEKHPGIAFIYSYLLGGFQVMGRPPRTEVDLVNLRLFFESSLIPFLKKQGVSELSYSTDTQELLDMMRALSFDKETYEQAQLIYIGRRNVERRAVSTCPFQILRINRELYESSPVFLSRYVPEILESWKSMDDFLKYGFGFLAIDAQTGSIAGNLLANAVYGGAYVVGADTEPAYRRKGIASTLLSHAIRLTQERDCDLIWECAEPNTASILTAQSCGLSLCGRYPVRWFNI